MPPRDMVFVSRLTLHTSDEKMFVAKHQHILCTMSAGDSAAATPHGLPLLLVRYQYACRCLGDKAHAVS